MRFRFAEHVGCSTQTVRAFESGRRQPSREMATRLAEILHVPAADQSEFMRLARVPQSAPKQEGGATTHDAVVTAVSQPPGSHPGVALPSDALIGRHDDLQRLHTALLDDQRRLVTLLGPGGIGKTRLALQGAVDLAPRFPHGVAFVALASVADSTHVVTAIAAAVNCPLRASPDPEAALLAFLHERAMLLVLDNLEHLLGPQRR